MNKICSHFHIFLRQVTSARMLVFSLILMFTIAGSSHYIRVPMNTTSSKAPHQYGRYRLRAKSSIPIVNGFNSCPREFRTRKPQFAWPPHSVCDAKCAIDSLEEVLPSVPWFLRYYREFFNSTEISSDVKWFNLARFLRVTTTRLKHLGLLPPTKRKFFLDIGTGFGYLPFLASHFNHCVIAIDSYSNVTHRFSNFFPEMIKILGVDLRQQTILPLTPITKDLFGGIKFDVISAYLGWFHCAPRMWSLSQWMFFLEDLAEHHTTDDALVYLNLNRCRYKNKTSIEYLWTNKTMGILRRKGVEFMREKGIATTMKITDLRAFRRK